jgi:hypothetical protein
MILSDKNVENIFVQCFNILMIAVKCKPYNILVKTYLTFTLTKSSYYTILFCAVNKLTNFTERFTKNENLKKKNVIIDHGIFILFIRSGINVFNTI